MNFIYTTLLFLISGSASIGISAFTEKSGAWHQFYIIVGTISIGISVIFFISMFLAQMNYGDSQRELFNEIRKTKKKLDNRNSYFEKFKTHVEDFMVKAYPNHEDKIFKNMTPTDSENLSAILIKYPELKFDGVLKSYVSDIKETLEDILDLENRLENLYENHNNFRDNRWIIKSYALPSDLAR